MYELLESHFALLGMSKEDAASMLGIGHDCLILKLEGGSGFTLDEAIALKKILMAEESIEELFGRML